LPLRGNSPDCRRSGVHRPTGAKRRLLGRSKKRFSGGRAARPGRRSAGGGKRRGLCPSTPRFFEKNRV